MIKNKSKNPFKMVEANMLLALKDIFYVLKLDCLAIASHQNGVEPKRSYCSVNTLSFDKQGKSNFEGGYVSWSEEDYQAYQHKSTAYESLVQLTFFGPESDENAFVYYDSLSGNSVVNEILTKHNIASRRYSNLRRAPQLRGSEWIDSWSYDHTLGFALSSKQSIDWVDVVIVNDYEVTLDKEA